jgi:hypothetical protein
MLVKIIAQALYIFQSHLVTGQSVKKLHQAIQCLGPRVPSNGVVEDSEGVTLHPWDRDEPQVMVQHALVVGHPPWLVGDQAKHGKKRSLQIADPVVIHCERQEV